MPFNAPPPQYKHHTPSFGEAFAQSLGTALPRALVDIPKAFVGKLIDTSAQEGGDIWSWTRPGIYAKVAQQAALDKLAQDRATMGLTQAQAQHMGALTEKTQQMTPAEVSQMWGSARTEWQKPEADARRDAILAAQGQTTRDLGLGNLNMRELELASLDADRRARLELAALAARRGGGGGGPRGPKPADIGAAKKAFEDAMGKINLPAGAKWVDDGTGNLQLIGVTSQAEMDRIKNATSLAAGRYFDLVRVDPEYADVVGKRLLKAYGLEEIKDPKTGKVIRKGNADDLWNAVGAYDIAPRVQVGDAPPGYQAGEGPPMPRIVAKERKIGEYEAGMSEKALESKALSYEEQAAIAHLQATGAMKRLVAELALEATGGGYFTAGDYGKILDLAAEKGWISAEDLQPQPMPQNPYRK